MASKGNPGMAANRNSVFGTCPPSIALCPTVDIDELASVVPGSRMGYNWPAKPGRVTGYDKHKHSHPRLPQCWLLTSWTSRP